MQAALALLAAAAEAFYLPGVAPREYADGERVEIKVHKLSSQRTQLPYDYYSMPFCHPANHTKIHRYPENVGEIMLGDDTYASFQRASEDPTRKYTCLLYTSPSPRDNR